MADYIPASDAEFFLWEKNFIEFIESQGTAFGVPEPLVEAIVGGQPNFENAWTNLTVVRQQGKVATEQKDFARSELQNHIRAAVRIMLGSPSMDTYQRIKFGLNVPKTPAPVPTPATCPVARVDTSQRLQHAVFFTDEATPTRKARPGASIDCEVWRTVTDLTAPAPNDPAEYELIGTASKSPFTAPCTAAEAGKQAYYLLRWTNRTGGNGPWSESVAATIVA